MSEVRRFLRFTLPGVAFAIQILLAFSISDYSVVAEFITSKNLFSNIGFIVGAFIASGGIGYFLANIYFALYWSWPFKKIIAINHLDLLIDLIDSNKIELLNGKGETIEHNILTKRDAWIIVTQFWYANIEQNTAIKGTEEIAHRIVDITHGLGATFMGTVFSFVLWAIYHQSNSQNYLIIGLWAFLAICFGCSWLRANKALQSICNSTITQAIYNDSTGSIKKIFYIR